MRSRFREPELMDDPALDPVEHDKALRGLARMNRISGTYNSLIEPIVRLSRTVNSRTLSVLDIATGSGDVPIAICKAGASLGVKLNVSGCDISDTAISRASRNAAEAGAEIEFFKWNALEEEIPRRFDVIVNSLFLHHLDETNTVRLLSKMRESATRLVIVNDLERTTFSLATVFAASRLFSTSPVVHFDGPASVRAAYSMDELAQLAARAGLTGFSLKRHFPCRMLLEYRQVQT